MVSPQHSARDLIDEMKDKDNQEADAAELAAVGGGVNHNREGRGGSSTTRKRRLSKRERKNLKKRQFSVPSAGNGSNDPLSDDAPTAQHTNTTQSSPTLEEYMVNYIPAPPVKRTQIIDGMDTFATTTSDAHSKSLGKWFPTASVIKSSVCYSNDYLAKLDMEKKRLAKDAAKSHATAAAAAAADIPEPKASLVLFYQYVSPTWSQAKVTSFINYLTNIAKNHRSNIGGRIRVSIEGINATVSAASTTNSKLDPAFEAAQTLRHFAQDLRQFDPVAFANTDFKYVDGLSADRHFKELKLLPVKELVFYGIKEEDCAVAPASTTTAADSSVDSGGKEVKGGVHLDATEYHEMLKRKDAVVIDVRNHYEAAIGRFDGQMEKESKMTKRTDDDNDGEKTQEDSVEGPGAQYIDPKMRKSTDFTSWLAEPETKQKLEGKTVLMFCTGGIRCERASAYLNAQMGNEVKGVYQLQGGIERYLQAFPDGGFWRGKNFVFDKREAIGAGHVNGVGGVVRMDTAAAGGNELIARKKDGKSKAKGSSGNQTLDWGAECANCRKPWDRYIGKRKCYTCGVPVLVCDTCLSQSSSAQEKKQKKKKKKASMKSDDGKGEDATTQHNPNGDDKTTEERMRLRCPLCVEEGITVPAEEVEYTDNGVRGRLTRTSGEMDEGGGSYATSAAGSASYQKEDNNKAAKSVLKWGGGHAAKKKEKNKLSRRPCQFGSECVRKDCFFYHPEREKKTL